jgi:lipoprotein signal peptidase
VAVVAHAMGLARKLRVPGTVGLEGLTFVSLLLALEQGFAFSFTQNTSYVLSMGVVFLDALVVQVVVLARVARGARAAASAPPSVAHT